MMEHPVTIRMVQSLLYFLRTSTMSSVCLNFQLVVLGSTTHSWIRNTWGWGSLAAWLLQFIFIVHEFYWLASNLAETRLTDPPPTGLQLERIPSPDHRRRGYRDLDKPRRSPVVRYRRSRSRSPRRWDDFSLTSIFTCCAEMAGAQQWRWQFSHNLPRLLLPSALSEVRSCSAQPQSTLCLFVQSFS